MSEAAVLVSRLQTEARKGIAAMPRSRSAFTLIELLVVIAIIAILAALLLPVLAIAAGALTDQMDERLNGGLNWLSLAYSLWEGFMCVSLVIVVLAWFRKRFDHQGRLAKVMSDNCFAVYILHPIVIVPLALALSGISLNLGLKFALVAPLAVALCYLVASLIRKVPFVRSVL